MSISTATAPSASAIGPAPPSGRDIRTLIPLGKANSRHPDHFEIPVLRKRGRDFFLYVPLRSALRGLSLAILCEAHIPRPNRALSKFGFMKETSPSAQRIGP